MKGVKHAKHHFLNAVRKRDLFGYQVALNYDKNQNKKKSLLGGTFSLIIQIYMILYIVQKWSKLVSVTSFDIKEFGLHKHPETIGNVPFNQQNFTMLYVLRSHKHQKFIEEKELSRYLNISYAQIFEDWQNNPENPTDQAVVRKSRYIAARQCTKDDFGSDNHTNQFFNSWSGFNLFCPNLDNDRESMILFNELGADVTSYVQFQIEKCIGKTKSGDTCHTEPEINEFLKDVSIEGWTIEERLNLEEGVHEPTFKSMQL